MKNFMKNTKTLMIFLTLAFTLTAFPVFAVDSPSAEELAKMNAAVAKITALMADAKMAVPLRILADQLKTSSDPEAIKAGAKIEKMADDMSSGGSGGGTSSFGSHGGGGMIPKATAPSWTTVPITSGLSTTNTKAPATKLSEDMKTDINVLVNTKGPKEVEYETKPPAIEAIKYSSSTKIFK